MTKDDLLISLEPVIWMSSYVLLILFSLVVLKLLSIF